MNLPGDLLGDKRFAAIITDIPEPRAGRFSEKKPLQRISSCGDLHALNRSGDAIIQIAGQLLTYSICLLHDEYTKLKRW